MDSKAIDFLNSLVSPFTVPPQDRSADQISAIQETMKKFNFFKVLESDRFFKALCQVLTLEVFEPFEKLANFGEILEKCYFVIYGGLNVLIPELNSPMNMSQKQVKETLTRQTTFLRKNTIETPSAKDIVARMKSIIGVRQNIRRGSVKVDSDFVRKLSKLSEFRATLNLAAGESFGDYVLTEKKPCNSYVEAKNITICAVLSKEDYLKAVQLEEEKLVIEKAEFLHKIPIFSSTSKMSLLKLAACFTIQKFSKNQVVYREDMPADFIYFIESGDFQVSKCQDSVTRKIIEIPKGFLSSQKSLLKIENARDIKLTHEVQMAIRGKYEVLGYDEYFTKQSLRSHSCKCVSANGCLYAVKTSDFRQRVVDPDALNYLKTRVDTHREREKFLEGAGKIMSSMSKIESKPVIPTLSTLTRGDEYLKNLISSMHEKKIEKKSVLSEAPSGSWNYPTIEYSFLERPKKVVEKYSRRSLSPKVSEMPLPVKLKDRIKRVPPPNFMIGMRDLQRVYDQDLRVEQIPQRSRNLSSIY